MQLMMDDRTTYVEVREKLLSFERTVHRVFTVSLTLANEIKVKARTNQRQMGTTTMPMIRAIRKEKVAKLVAKVVKMEKAKGRMFQMMCASFVVDAVTGVHWSGECPIRCL